MPLPDTWNEPPIEPRNTSYIDPYCTLINLSLLMTLRTMNKAITGSTALSPEDISTTITEPAAALAPSEAELAVSAVD
jgi:hypothetical protein